MEKEKLQKLIEIKGETRGFNIKGDGEYILKIRGRDGLEKLEKQLGEWGYSIKYLELDDIDFYPVGLRVISLLAIKEALGFAEQDIRKMGSALPKLPLAVRLFAKYFYSIEKIMKKVQDMWAEYYTVGQMLFPEFNEKEGYAILQIKNLELGPLWCKCTEGYFEGLAKMILKKENLKCKETKCTHKGDPFHEFLIEWKK